MYSHYMISISNSNKIIIVQSAYTSSVLLQNMSFFLMIILIKAEQK